jgi:hypothetical protein
MSSVIQRIDRRVRYILVLPLFAICSAAYADSQPITVNDPRPVAKAVEKLEAIYGWSITYEDPPYVHESEIADVTEQLRRDRQDVSVSGVNRVLIPRGRDLSFTFDGDASTPREAIWQMLASYDAALGSAGMFNLVEGNRVFHVVPNQFTDQSGRREKIAPLLSLTVSVLPKQRTVVELVEEICDSLSLATGHTVVVGTTPWLKSAKEKTTITASQETALSVLSRLLVEMPVPLSWQLFYDPGVRWYVLNIHAVGTLANN